MAHVLDCTRPCLEALTGKTTAFKLATAEECKLDVNDGKVDAGALQKALASKGLVGKFDTELASVGNVEYKSIAARQGRGQ